MYMNNGQKFLTAVIHLKTDYSNQHIKVIYFLYLGKKGKITCQKKQQEKHENEIFP